MKSEWVIFDEWGNEKAVFNEISINTPNLISSKSPVYSLGNAFYNIETGYMYGEAYTKMKTENYLFLDNAYDKDENKKGVIKIDLKTGEFEIFK